MLTPVDLTMTSLASSGASSRAISVFSSGLASNFGDARLRSGGGVSGVAGDKSNGVSIGELEREGGFDEPVGLGEERSVSGRWISGGGGTFWVENDGVCRRGGVLRDVVGLCSAEKLMVELPL